jgi:hypothetical protein
MFIIVTGTPNTGFIVFGPWDTALSAYAAGRNVGEPEYLFKEWWVVSLEQQEQHTLPHFAEELRERTDLSVHLDGDLIEGWQFSGPYAGETEDGVRILHLETAWR